MRGLTMIQIIKELELERREKKEGARRITIPPPG
jgi:hypothetical protein